MSSTVRNRRARARSRSRSSADSTAPVATTFPVEQNLSPAVLMVTMLLVTVVTCAILAYAATVPVDTLSPAVLPVVVLLVIMAVFALVTFWILPNDRLQILFEFASASGSAIASGIYTVFKELASGIVALLSRFFFRLSEMLIGVARVFHLGIQEIWAVFTVENISMVLFLAIVFTYFPDVSNKKFNQVLEKSFTKAVPLPSK